MIGTKTTSMEGTPIIRHFCPKVLHLCPCPCAAQALHWASKYSQAELGMSAFTVVSPAPIPSLVRDPPPPPSFTFDTVTVLQTQGIGMGSGWEGLLSPEGCRGERAGGRGGLT